jgi:hypothetical protein
MLCNSYAYLLQRPLYRHSISQVVPNTLPRTAHL